MRSRSASGLLLWAFAIAIAIAPRANAQQSVRLAAMSGHVLADATERPLVGAQITVVSMRLSTQADSLGRFLLTGILPGRQLVTVSQIGFEPLRTYIVFLAADTVDADIVLTPLPASSAQPIAKMNVVANAVPRGLEDFERRRLTGVGDFMNEAAIRKASRGELTDVVRRIPGIQLSRPASGFGAYASAGRGATRGRPCYVAVMIDRTWVYEGKRGDLPFDLNSISPDIVIGMEFYRGLSYIPAEFGKERSTCGTLVIWTKTG